MNTNDILTIILLLPVIAVPVGLIVDLFRHDWNELFRRWCRPESRYDFTPVAYDSSWWTTTSHDAGFTSKESCEHSSTHPINDNHQPSTTYQHTSRLAPLVWRATSSTHSASSTSWTGWMELAQHSTTLRGAENPGRDWRAERGRVCCTFLSCASTPQPLQSYHDHITTNQLHRSHGVDHRLVLVHHSPVSLTTNTRRHMFKIMRHDTCVAVTQTINEAMKVVRSLEAGLNRLKQHSPYTILRAE